LIRIAHVVRSKGTVADARIARLLALESSGLFPDHFPALFPTLFPDLYPTLYPTNIHHPSNNSLPSIIEYFIRINQSSHPIFDSDH